jgi:lysophospholipase
MKSRRRETIDRRAIPSAAQEAMWTTADGHDIRRVDWTCSQDSGPGLRGSILFLPGRGDFYEKYLESLDYWHSQGWRVTALDWRGQAGSGRMSAHPTTGHISDFSVWVDDLAAFWGTWVQETPAPHVVIGHSMGGHLVLRAVAEKRIDPVALVLSAPMLGFLTPGPNRLLRLVAEMFCRLGDPERAAWKTSEKPGASVAARNTLLTHDEARYDDETYWKTARPYLAMGPGSWRWVERAYASVIALDQPGILEAVDLPVLMLSARYDGLVSWQAIEAAAKRLPRAQLVSWGREARHELLREVDLVRDKAIYIIDDFLDRMAPLPVETNLARR